MDYQQIKSFTHPWFSICSLSMLWVILSLSPWVHLSTPATYGMFLLMTGPEGVWARATCWSKMSLALSSSWSNMASRVGYLCWKSLWMRGRSIREPIISSSWWDREGRGEGEGGGEAVKGRKVESGREGMGKYNEQEMNRKIRSYAKTNYCMCLWRVSSLWKQNHIHDSHQRLDRQCIRGAAQCLQSSLWKPCSLREIPAERQLSLSHLVGVISVSYRLHNISALHHPIWVVVNI